MASNRIVTAEDGEGLVIRKVEDHFCCVEKNLYIGSYQSICLLQESAERLPQGDDVPDSSNTPTPNVSGNEGMSDVLRVAEVAVLTVDSRKLPKELTQLFSAYKFLNVDDSQQFEFIRHFDECCAFIEENRSRNKKVLVHCNAGMSRSATIVAAYLMKEHGYGVKECVELIKKARTSVEPNSNFYQQLQLYGTMGCTLDSHNPAYRQWRLRLLTQTGFPVVEIETLLADTPGTGPNASDVFCCRICRCPLFGLSNQLLHHTKVTVSGEQNVAGSASSNPPVCAQKEIFIEPVMWMKDEIAQVEGKLNCPQCSKKIGAFSWFGEKCPCGVFVTPAFHMDKGKVEIRKAITVAGHPR